MRPFSLPTWSRARVGEGNNNMSGGSGRLGCCGDAQEGKNPVNDDLIICRRSSVVTNRINNNKKFPSFLQFLTACTTTKMATKSTCLLQKTSTNGKISGRAGATTRSMSGGHLVEHEQESTSVESAEECQYQVASINSLDLPIVARKEICKIGPIKKHSMMIMIHEIISPTRLCLPHSRQQVVFVPKIKRQPSWAQDVQ
jgi:hypothetical protein